MLNKRESLKGKEVTRSSHVNMDMSTEANKVTFTFISNDNGGSRYNWETGETYIETLDVNGADTSKLNTFFKNHNRDVDSAIGKIDNVRVEKDMLVGDVTFGSDENSKNILQKYKDGILTDVSIGYRILDYTMEKSADNEQDKVTVTNYEIFEVSSVGIGFDSGAKKRNNGGSVMNEEMLERLSQLETQTKRNAKETSELKSLQEAKLSDELKNVEASRQSLADKNIELERKIEVNSVLSVHTDSFSDSERKEIDESKKTADEVRAMILDKQVSSSKEFGTLSVTTDSDDIKRAMIDGIALRLGTINLKDAHKDSAKWRNAPLSVIANQLLKDEDRSFDPVVIAERAMVTGQFPQLLMNAGNRVLENEFDAQAPTFGMWTNEVDVPDFRQNTSILTGQGGRLSKKLENGDLKELSVTEKAETWNLESFGNKFVLTREMIINDDLGAFTDMLSLFAQMAATTVNGYAYDLLRMTGEFANYKMGDGSAVYSVAAHGNKLSLPLDPASLSSSRQLMRKQKGLDGKTPLNIIPKFLIVGAKLEQTGLELLGSSSKIGASNSGEINVHQNSLELIVDAELNDTEWYLSASRRTIKVGYLAGTMRKPVLKMDNSSLIRTTFEGIFDIGFVFEDYRTIVQGNQ